MQVNLNDLKKWRKIEWYRRQLYTYLLILRSITIEKKTKKKLYMYIERFAFGNWSYAYDAVSKFLGNISTAAVEWPSSNNFVHKPNDVRVGYPDYTSSNIPNHRLKNSINMACHGIVGTIYCLFCIGFCYGHSIQFRKPNQIKWLDPSFLEDFIWAQSS